MLVRRKKIIADNGTIYEEGYSSLMLIVSCLGSTQMKPMCELFLEMMSGGGNIGDKFCHYSHGFSTYQTHRKPDHFARAVLRVDQSACVLICKYQNIIMVAGEAYSNNNNKQEERRNEEKDSRSKKS